jgi:hypoxanthine phosphoribosyltransferase
MAARMHELTAELVVNLCTLPEPLDGVAMGTLLFLTDPIHRIDIVRIESYGADTESYGAPRIMPDLKINIAGKHIWFVRG